MLKFYQYPKCGTCRKARKWLDARGIAYNAIDIVAEPPSRTMLARVKKLAGVPMNKMFNTSGQSYRQGGYKDKLATMSEKDALAALAADGKLVKRPLLVGDDFALVGFVEEQWSQALHA